MNSKILKKLSKYRALILVLTLTAAIGAYLLWDTNFGFLSSVIGEPVSVNAVGGRKGCEEGCVGGKYQYYNKKKDVCMAKESNKCKPKSNSGSSGNNSGQSNNGSSIDLSNQPPAGNYNSCGKVCYEARSIIATDNCGSKENEGKRQFIRNEGCGCKVKFWAPDSGEGKCDYKSSDNQKGVNSCGTACGVAYKKTRTGQCGSHEKEGQGLWQINQGCGCIIFSWAKDPDCN